MLHGFGLKILAAAEFAPEGWDTLEIEATTTHETMGHSVPPAAPE